MIKEGDCIEDKITGKVYQVKMIRNGTVLLETEDGSGQILTDRTTVKTFYQLKNQEDEIQEPSGARNRPGS
jgi:ribosomal protein S4E